MNRATLVDLQRQNAYPSVTVLLNTTPGSGLSASEIATAERLVSEVARRLTGDVDASTVSAIIATLEAQLDDLRVVPASHAVAMFASPDTGATVQLGCRVIERVTIDDTFTTRDLVADLNRTALYRVVTLSERMVRVFVGDRQRLVEQRDHIWPLIRTDEDSSSAWSAEVATRLRAEHKEHAVPYVYAGVQRSIATLTPAGVYSIGAIKGNHDRATASQLHAAAWPVVSDWLRTDATRAMQQLEVARSANRCASGIEAIWPLALAGRIDTVVVEAGYAYAATVDDRDQVHPAGDPEARDVHDDIIDDVVELVLTKGGNAVIVEDGALDDHRRIAATLRY